VAVDVERDLILAPMNVDEIRRLAAAAGGVEKLLSTKSPKHAQYKDRISGPEDWVTFMAEEPRLIKRPLIERDGVVYIGFDSKAWEALLP
jgi:arsenate reductase-like glutaredoxin family protein